MIAGTRGSALARWQTDHVISKLGQPVTVEVITTKGDVDRTSKLQGRLEKGFFTEELEAALRERRVDFAVHSLKDLPTVGPEDLVLGAVLERAAANDRILCRAPLPLPDGARVGASSLRREALLKTHFPAARAEHLRGNVPTRVKRLEDGEYDAIILAAAGLSRLGIAPPSVHQYQLNPQVWIPAPGQGAVAVQCRRDDVATREALRVLQHGPTARAVHIERELLRVFEGGCSAPFGALVVGSALHVGAELEGRWHCLAKELPPAPDDSFYRRTLDELADSHSQGLGGWLYQPA